MSLPDRFDARSAAAHVLARVFVDEAHASAVLDRAVAGLAPRDAALATELTYGVLRTEGFLVDTARAYSRRGTLIDHPEALAQLLIGVYSLSFLDRVPAFAAVSEAVSAIKQLIGDKPAAFANAILRAYADKLQRRPRPKLADAIFESTPGWLKGALRTSLGRREAQSFLAAAATSAPLHLAVGDPALRSEILEEVRGSAERGWRTAPPGQLDRAVASEGHGGTFELGAHSPHAIVARGVAHPRSLSGFETRWIVQEEGAQLCALALGDVRAATVLDACAGRGNKSWLLSHRIGPLGTLTLADTHPNKLEAFLARDPRVARTETHGIDWRAGAGDLGSRTFDHVLVDAPCTGVGTLRRRPEIARLRTPESVEELARLQLEILTRVAPLVRPGGTLVYAVCSVLRAECEDVLAAFAEAAPSFAPAPLVEVLPALVGDDSTRSVMRLLPELHGTDGFFFARFRRT
jgi:16S rRNA (cytosine967-C5)-methyltransferase